MRVIAVAGFVLFSFAAPASLVAQTTTLPGDLDVAGNLDVRGVTSAFGSLTSDPLLPALKIHAFGNGSTNFDIQTSNGILYWRRLNSAGTTFTEAMRLTVNNHLEIRPPNGGANLIQLKPETYSVFTGGLIVGGTDNRLTSQTLTGPTSILTQGLGDGRYLRRDGQNLNFGPGTSATGLASIALGNQTEAFSPGNETSIALGSNSIARADTTWNRGSLALGWNARAGTANAGHAVAIGSDVQAHGSESTAIGRGALTQGYGTTAMGPYSSALGGWSTALGFGSYSTGYMATAIGPGTQANAYAQTVVGISNIPDTPADPNQPDSEGHVFIVGNGDSQPLPYRQSNAFTIKRNGNGWLQGTLSVAGGLNVSGETITTGNAQFSGHTSLQDASVSGTLRIPPRGGISMGEFTHDPTAP